MLAQVRRGRYFTPPRLSDSEKEGSPEKSPPQVQQPENPPHYIDSPINTPDFPRTPGRTEEEESTHGEMGDATPEVSNPSGTVKRPGEDTGAGGAPKRVKSGNKKLPGTGKPQGLEGNADRTIIYLERPMNSKVVVISKFSKQHKFLTFGIASKVLSQEIAAVDPVPGYTQYFLTTALAEIPVHKLPLYMNPSEFSLLPVGAEIIELKITVVQRNALLSFQTNASSSSLATLNQNKNGVYAIGLNKTNYGCNRRYASFNDTEPMIPTSSEPPVYGPKTTDPLYEGLEEDLYGVNNVDPTFNSSVPKHQVGMYTTLQNYFCLTNSSRYVGGWPLLQEKYTEYDAASMVGEVICTYTYNPKVGLIKLPQKYLPLQLPAVELNVPHGTMQSSVELYKYNPTEAAPTVTYENSGRYSAEQINFGYLDDIEKSQWYFQGPADIHSAKIQPTLHIGINPVPALTTGSIISGLSNSNFTDTRSYFDVHCEAVVGVRQYTDRPFAENYNCSFGEQYYKGLISPNSNSVPIGTLYPSDPIAEA